jgi:hypothetical protein
MKYRNYMEMGALSRRTALKDGMNYTDHDVDEEFERIKSEFEDMQEVFTLVGIIKAIQNAANPEEDPENSTDPKVVAKGTAGGKTKPATQGKTSGKQGQMTAGFRGG